MARVAHAAAAKAYKESHDSHEGPTNQSDERKAKKDKRDKIMGLILKDTTEDDAQVDELCAPEKTELPKWNDLDKFESPIIKAWITFTKPFYELAYGDKLAAYFDMFIIIVIIIAGMMVGIQTYPKYACPSLSAQADGAWKDTITGHPKKTIEFCEANGDDILGGDGVIDKCVQWIFVLECCIKILANGAAPYRYWCGHADYKWNNFDFMIVAFSFDEFAALILGGGGGGTINVLRLFRLARLLKLVGKIPKLQSIVIGLVAGIKAVAYIALLLFLVFYIFAIAGMIFFMPNDPFHFRNIGISMLSLFRAATLEDWTDIMYINIYGCDKYASGLYYVKSSYVDQSTKSDIPGAFDGNPFYSSWAEVPNYFRCNDFEGESVTRTVGAAPEASVIYWVMFTFVSAFVMLSLFVGAVTLAMSESMDPSEKGEDDGDWATTLKKKRNALKDCSEEFRARLVHGWNVYASENGILDRIEEQPSKSPYRWGVYSRFAEMCKTTAENPVFAGVVTFTIIVAGVTVGIEQNHDPEEGTPALEAPRNLDLILWYMDVVINWIFTVEVTMKILGEDWHPWTYFYSGWNQFDFVIVFCSWLPLLMAGGLPFPLKLLRLLRLFRILRVIKFLPALAVIVESLLVGMESIGFIAIILFVVFYLFAILGMMIFEKNDPFHFGELHRALLTLFRVSTFEDWTDVMYTNMYSCSQWGYGDDDTLPKPSMCNKYFGEADGYGPPPQTTAGKSKSPGVFPGPKWYAAIFFIVFVFLGALVLLTLFVGVITTSMETAQDKQDKMSRSLALVKDLANPRKGGHNIPSPCTEAIAQAFAAVDLDNNGELSLEEIKVMVKFTELVKVNGDQAEMFEAEALMKKTWEDMDLNENGNISLYEFTVYIMNHLAAMANSSKKFGPPEKVEDENDEGPKCCGAFRGSSEKE
jgi:voltage-gated sodium channel